jgi:hypothetical protein
MCREWIQSSQQIVTYVFTGVELGYFANGFAQDYMRELSIGHNKTSTSKSILRQLTKKYVNA